METKDYVSEVNVQAVKRLAESEGWKEMRREINMMIEDLRDLLEKGSAEDERHRGRVDALREIIVWPDVVIDYAKYSEQVDG
jgi:hypothetical protein